MKYVTIYETVFSDKVEKIRTAFIMNNIPCIVLDKVSVGDPETFSINIMGARIQILRKYWDEAEQVMRRIGTC